MLMKNIKFVFTCLIVAAVLVDVNSQSQSVCRISSEENGLCVPILSCEPIIKLLLMSPKPLPPSVAESVKQLQCGTFDNSQHVCCKQNNAPNGSSYRESDSLTDSDVQTGMAILESTSSICGRNLRSKLEIGNGEDALLAEFPWMALLVYEKGSERTLECGGSLITDRYVLTAAHCIQVRSMKLVSVRLGEHDLTNAVDCANELGEEVCLPPVQEIDIEEAIYHEDFSARKFSDDIGLIRLRSKATFSQSVRPICLPVTAELQASILNTITIAGWGRVENGQRANILQSASIPVKENDYCQQIHKLIRISDKQICAGGERNIDTCKGDSGGPIFRYAGFNKENRCIQYGVVSAGGSLCGERFPGIYVKVASYLQWIAGHIRP